MILREVSEADLELFFEHQRDEVAARMAGFQPRERQAFLAHWHSNVLRPGHLNRTLVVDGQAVGYIGSWEQDSQRLVAYWIGREHWGRGLATRALLDFLKLEPVRPLHAWVAAHNAGSIRVLEKCGFRLEAPESRPPADGVPEVLMTLSR